MNHVILALLALSGVGSQAYAQAPVATATPGVSAPAPAPGAPATSAPAPTTQSECTNRDDGSSLCVNDRILDYRNQEGVIETIYSDYTGIIAYDDGTKNTLDLQYVAREVSCIYGFCAGDTVADSDGYQGTITDIFENGVAEVTYPDGEVYYLAVNELTAVDGQSVEPSYPWPDPRPFPDVTIYDYPFGLPPVVLLYGYPYGYPYPFPIYGRRLFGICPEAPLHFGYHPFNPYPFAHPVPWNNGFGGGHFGGGRSPVGNQHGGFGGGHPGPVGGGHPGPVGGGHPGPVGGGHPGPVGGGHPGPVGGGHPGPVGGGHPGPVGGGHPGPVGGGGGYHPPGPVSGGGGYHPAPSGGGGGFHPAPSSGGGGHPSGGGFGGGGGHPGGGGGHGGGGHRKTEDTDA
jgi:hypothetical protein